MRLGLMLAGLLLAACGGLDQGKVTSSAPPARADAGMGASSQPSSSVTTHPIGTELTTGQGNTLTLHRVEWGVTNQYLSPTAGNQFVSVDVGGCASKSNTANVAMTMLSFTLQMPDNTRLNPSFFPIREPTLPGGVQLVPGDCFRGWLTFDVPILAPTGPAPVLNFSGLTTATVLKWALR